MSYCVAEDVQILLGFDTTFSASTIPTLTQVNGVIDQVTAEIDMLLASAGVGVPVANTTLLSYLKMKCASGTACRIGMTYFSNSTGVDGTQPKFYCDDYQEFKDSIKENPEKFLAAFSSGIFAVSNTVIDGTITEDTFKNQTGVKWGFKY
jgi:hypothetical protein